MTHVCIYSLESPVAVRETKTSLCCCIALRWQKQTKPSLSFFISVYFFCFYSLQQLLILFAQIQVSLVSFWVQLLLCSCRFEFLSFFWSETQVNTNQTLEFCDSYSGKTCCNSKDDLELQNRFNSMNISDSNCSSLLKSILCAVSTDLFTYPFSWIQDSLFQILQ